VLVLGLIRAAVMAVAGSVVTLAQLNLPSKKFWEDQVILQWISVITLALLILYDAVRTVNYALQIGQIRKYDNNLRAALSSVISSVVRDSGVPWDEVAVRYYRARRMLLRRDLLLIAAIQAGANIEDSSRVVRSGKGIVGMAFSDQEVIALEWRELVRVATDEGREKWEMRSEAARYGLSWGQLRRSEQPEGMLASPTFGVDGQPNGCILLSGPLKLPDMQNDELRLTLDDVATILDLLGAPPRGWWGTHA
jgi:hypothetical protein